VHEWSPLVSLGITRSDFGDVTVLVLNGNVTLGENHVFLKKEISRLLEDGRRKFVLDYSAVRYQDSAGNGALVESFTNIRNKRGELVLVGLQPNIFAMFQITKLYPVFKIFATSSSALDHFKVNPEDR
jgi:anti-sigma B factor antagonist